MTTSAEIILLNWNGRDYLDECLTNLLAQDTLPSKITLVDNGSTDGSVAFVRTTFPSVVIHENDANLGFAAGNNPALQAATADIAVLLNPDVMVAPDWLRRLTTRFEQDAAITVAGCKLWYPDGQTIQHAGGYITPPQAMPGHFGIGEIDTGQWDEPRDCDYVIGAALGLRTAVLPELGLLDEGYFLYYEDVDLCARARRAGGRVCYEPAATAIHVESATAVKGSFNYLRRFHTGRWRYLLKQMPGETIVDETFPAERDWLARIDIDERLAAALAYQATHASLDEIWQARELSGAGHLQPETMSLITAGLSELETVAWSLPSVEAPDLEASSALMRLFRTRHSALLAKHEATVNQYLERVAQQLREQTEARVASDAKTAALQAELNALRRKITQQQGAASSAPEKAKGDG